SGPKLFDYPSFLQNGPGYAGNRDGFMYVYATDADWGGANALRLARVPVTADLLDPSRYAYWTGAGWSAQLADAAELLPRSRDLGGMQSILYNAPLDRYFLVTFGDTHDRDKARMVV